MTNTTKPCFTVTISPPQIPPLFAGFPSFTLNLTPAIPPLAIPCCNINIPIPKFPVTTPPIPGFNVAIAAINAAIAQALTAQFPIPKCPL